jgi:hypothetical protein
MAQVTYDSAVTALLNALPEFEDSGAEWSRDLPYDVYGEFAVYVSKLIAESNKQQLPRLQRAFNFINSLADDGDESVVNLLQVAVLEALTDTPESVATVSALRGIDPLLLTGIDPGGPLRATW